MDTDYKTILSHSKTCWLSLYPALTRLIEMFEALKSYFLSISKCPVILKDFFQNPISLLITQFLHTQSELFYSVFKKKLKQKKYLLLK